eukprot:CAMPEP_0180656508 /NCGR_PEP_ID=MMETSP1037_2-20121125/55896_1 /TAXON_ID=632150 /ORGANISM="Azadinium spinosum, Strain 3D9" /LENGTH=39 /DNA_ID= /DNA_START= /DNA_END= /DNA_ORIENTATION=
MESLQPEYLHRRVQRLRAGPRSPNMEQLETTDTKGRRQK